MSSLHAQTENTTEKRSWLYWAVILLGPPTLYVYLNYDIAVHYVSEWISEGSYFHAVFWVIFYALCFITFFTLLIFFRGWKLYVFLGLSLLSALTNMIYKSIARTRIEPDAVVWLLDQNATLPNAYAEFSSQFIIHGAMAVGVMGLLIAWRSAILHNTTISMMIPDRKSWRVGAVIAFLGIHLPCLFVRPDYLAAEVNVPLLAIVSYFNPEPDPRVVPVNPVVRSNIDKVLLIVDESVRADYFKKIFGDSLKGLPNLDYGEAASTVNCSGGSNALLRWGLDQNRIARKDYDPRDAVYIWSYAKHAGYKTVLIDGQANVGNPQNFLGRKERGLIDERVLIRFSPETDVEIARELKKRFLNKSREFIYVVKRGAHFPFTFSYPEGYLSDEASRVEKYEAAIRYSTGRFFSEMSSGIDYSHVFAVYTSDHAVILGEGTQPNCNKVPYWEEYSVPLMVLTASQDITQKLSAGLALVRDHASHEQIFPTLLYAMGYSPSSIDSPRYATPLYDRWKRYTVLLPPGVPVVGRTYSRGISFKTFDAFPFRMPQEQ
jgi:hypothetical protein